MKIKVRRNFPACAPQSPCSAAWQPLIIRLPSTCLALQSGESKSPPSPRLTPPAAAGEKASEPETDPFGWDALISVWWDSPPCQDPTDGQWGERPS